MLGPSKMALGGVEGAELPYPSLGPWSMLGPSKMALGGGECPLAWAIEDGPRWG